MYMYTQYHCMKLVRIEIQKYLTPFLVFPVDLVQFTEEFQIPLPQINTLRGQALALLSQPEVRGQQYVSRIDAIQFFQGIQMNSQDAIQPFNKSFGIKRLKLTRGLYCLEFPFVNDRVHLDKRTNLQIDPLQRNDRINEIKQWWRNQLLDVPNEEWHVGHLDPTISDTSEANLVYQPPIQARYRDRFKWDAKFFKMWPTAKELSGNMDKYYTKEEQALLLESLKSKECIIE